MEFLESEQGYARRFSLQIGGSKARLLPLHRLASHRWHLYCEDLSRNNPGSTIVLECTPEEGCSRFKHMFVCYAASAIGFGYCPSFLGLDGTHLKMKYHGILLAATATDANRSLFPLPLAVVDAENDDNWFWFIQLLRRALSNMLHNSLSPEHFLLFLIAKKVSLKELSAYSPIHRMDIVSVISTKICGRISSIRSSRPSSGKLQKPLRMQISMLRLKS